MTRQFLHVTLSNYSAVIFIISTFICGKMYTRYFILSSSRAVCVNSRYNDFASGKYLTTKVPFLDNFSTLGKDLVCEIRQLWLTKQTCVTVSKRLQSKPLSLRFHHIKRKCVSPFTKRIRVEEQLNEPIGQFLEGHCRPTFGNKNHVMCSAEPG